MLARDVMATDVVPRGPGVSLRVAGRRMLDAGVPVGSVVVVDDGDRAGIVTRADVANHYGAFVREAHALESRRDDWEDRLADSDEFP